MNNEETKNESENTQTINPPQAEEKNETEAILGVTEETRPLGRPTKYTPELCQKVDDYLKESIDKELSVLKETENPDGTKEIVEIKRYKVQLPTIEGFALFLGVNKDTLYEWKKKYTNFSDSLDNIINIQKKRLLDEGLAGNYNPTIAKLILSSNHGMAEKTNTDLTTGGDKLNSEVVVRFVSGKN